MRIPIIYSISAALCCLGLAGGSARAIEPVEETYRILAGTTFEAAATGQDYAYLVWQARQVDLLRSSAHAVYAKPGVATSGASFSAQGVVQLQTRSQILETILNSTPRDVYDPVAFEETIDGLFGELMPAGNLTLAQKLSVVLRDAQSSADTYGRIIFLARTQPVLGVCIGAAAIVPMPAAVATFELRAQADGGTKPGVAYDVVAGRVTLDADSPAPIPAPPRPEQVEDESPSGHLNAKLRWDTTAALARATPLTYGYNVYRMNAALAEGANYHVTPPSPEQLENLIRATPDLVAQVNELPILPASDDPGVPFIVDGPVLAGPDPAFSDGNQLYYFVAARDLLGRPGQLSRGLLVTMCDRMPPAQPSDVTVKNLRSYNPTTKISSVQLQVSWTPSSTGDQPTGGYYVYRWNSPAAMLADGAANNPAPAAPASPLIPHVPGKSDYSWTDTSAGAPTVADDARQTFWYTVKAVDDTACGPLTSGDSAPGWGVPRDYTGPAAPGACLTVTRTCPDMLWQDPISRDASQGDLVGFTGPTGQIIHVQLKAERIDAAIKHVEWSISLPGEGEGDPRTNTPIGEGAFTPNVNALIFKRRVPSSYFGDLAEAEFVIRATDCVGKQVSARVEVQRLPRQTGQITELCVRIRELTETNKIQTGGVGGTSLRSLHTTADPTTGEINPLEIEFTMPATAQEYKLYKRIDGGPLLLVEQKAGVAPGSVEEIEDAELPANSAEICYFVQYFNADGTPSALAKIGCIRTTSKVDMPVPILAEVESAGSAAEPQAVLTWFSETDGVDHFRLYIGDGLTRVETDYSDELEASVDTVTPLFVDPIRSTITTLPYPGELVDGVRYYPYNTGRINGGFGNPATPNEFSITLDVIAGREYHFYVKTVSAADDRSEPSNIVSFTWTPEPVDDTVVPWPARPLPPVDDGFLPEVEADFVEAINLQDWIGACVQIGTVTESNDGFSLGSLSQSGETPVLQTPTSFPDSSEFSLDLFTTPSGETVFPCVLYRVQLPNLLYPAVSGDVVQITPMLEKVRTRKNEASDRIELWDPFIETFIDPDGGPKGIYIKDSQGVVKGARYRYLLARFKDNKEIDRVVPAGEVTIPLQ